MYSIVKYGVIAAAVGISAEFVWYVYKRYRKQCQTDDSIDVLFVNISRGCCFGLETECSGEHCVGRVTRRILDSIDTAKSTIRLAMYRISYKPFVDAIIRAKVRGVKVQVLVDQRLVLDNGVREFERKGLYFSVNLLFLANCKKYSNGNSRDLFYILGVTVRWFDRLQNRQTLNTDFILHHKFCIIDAGDNGASDGTTSNSHGAEGGLFIGGSLNWTRNV